MGCYSFTCAVSGLPIGADDPVYYLLVQQSPWVDRSAWDAWVPRTLPLRGLYDSYGGVKDIADDAARAVWAECLDDVMRRSHGRNAVHDVPTFRGMTFEQIDEAARKGRLRVQSDRALVKRSVDPTIPTMRRIEKRLRRANLPIFAKGQSGLIVKRVGYDTCLVRVRKYGLDLDAFSLLQAAMDTLRNVYIVDSVSVPDGLLVKTYPRSFGGDRTRSVEVRPCLIREDVWQAVTTSRMLGLGPNEEPIDFEHFCALHSVDFIVNPFTTSPGTHYNKLKGRMPIGYETTCREFRFLMNVLRDAGIPFRPSRAWVDQEPSWGPVSSLWTKFALIAAKKVEDVDLDSIRILKAGIQDDSVCLWLSDGGRAWIRIDDYPRLSGAALEQLNNYRLIGGGRGINWPDLDEDISLRGLLRR